MNVEPAKSLNGTISVPGDKSISHRAVILAAIAEGESRIENFATGEDCASTIRCLRQLGVGIEQTCTTVVVKGVGKTGFRKPNDALNCGNSGTTMRLLAGLLAGQPFDSVLTGDESLRKRPMRRIVEPLEKMGARVETTDGFAPVGIHGRNPLKAVTYETPVASAQLKSCVLLAGLNAEGTTTVVEETQTRDHTERMLRWLGGDLTVSIGTNYSGVIEVDGSSSLKARNICIPGDISSAAFLIVAAACFGNSQLEITYVGTNPSRVFFIEKLRSLGVDICITGGYGDSFEPAADIRVHGSSLLPTDDGRNVISTTETAQMIDEIPILAVLGTQLGGGLEVRDASELRKKETDRIRAIVENFKRMNASIDEFDDGFCVRKSLLKGAALDSFGDHRIAMAFAVAGLLAEGDTTIGNSQCANISFPGFYEQLESVVQR